MKTSLVPILTVAIMLVGCQTLNQLNTVKNLVWTVTAAGVAWDVQQNKEHAPYFDAARAGIDQLLAAGKLDIDTLKRVVLILNMKELQGPGGILLVGTTVTVLDFATGEAFDIETPAAVQAVLTALRDGIKDGLAAVPTVMAPKLGVHPKAWKHVKV